MKAICPVSGVPFRTYDSLTLHLAYKHPIFSIPFESLVILLEDIREQEQKELASFDEQTVENRDATFKAATISDLTGLTVEAMHEKNYRNPVFKLYQTKHLVMLAFMHMADLLEHEPGYVARPSPQVIEAHFWQACELFIWVNTINNPRLLNEIPHYKVSKGNESLQNFNEYLELLADTKDKIGSRYRSFSEERKLEHMEKAIAILAKRRNALQQGIMNSSNGIAAKWALSITRAPKDIYAFWYGILASSSIKITFEGVRVGDKWESVNPSDLRELRDWLEDNLIAPKGNHKEYHRDDSEYYFIARQTVLDIVRNHLAILEQGSSSYKIVNAAMGDNILTATDDKLAIKAHEAGLPAKPDVKDHPTKVQMIVAMAKWRHATKTALLAMQVPDTPKLDKEEKAKYEIL